MTDQEARDYVEGAFQALKSRGWFQKTGLVPTGVTDRDRGLRGGDRAESSRPAESVFEILPDGLRALGDYP